MNVRKPSWTPMKRRIDTVTFDINDKRWYHLPKGTVLSLRVMNRGEPNSLMIKRVFESIYDEVLARLEGTNYPTFVLIQHMDKDTIIDLGHLDFQGLLGIGLSSPGLAAVEMQVMTEVK